MNCKRLAARYFAGFDDSSATRQPPNLPNHLVWSLGHMALTMLRAAEKIDGAPLAESDFLPGSRGDSRRFGAESVAFGSKPADDRSLYPPLERAVEIFNRACDRLGAAVLAASDPKLHEMTKWGAAEIALHALVTRMIFHNGTHVGQIADLRRAMGFSRVLG